MFWRIAALSLLHFAAASAAAFLTYGHDLDQLRSRSASSRAFGVLHDFLWYPHDVIFHVLLRSGWIATPAVLAPVMLVVSSLLWGSALHGAGHLLRRRRSQAARPPRVHGSG